MPKTSWDAIFQARRQLYHYVRLLQAERISNDSKFTTYYVERLAAAAQLMAHLEHVQSLPELRALVRQENGRFPRDVLATDGGRNARAAFNLFARYVTELEDYRQPDASVSTGPQSLVGEQLSGVTFQVDRLVLDFHGQSLAADCTSSLEVNGDEIPSQAEEFPHLLRSALLKKVLAVQVEPGALTVVFDSVRVRMSDFPDEGMLWFENHDGESRAL